MRILSILLLLCSTAVAEDIRPHLDGNRIRYLGPMDQSGQPVIEIGDFRNLPYDYARKMTPELYYWWVLAHNSRQLDKTSVSSSGVLQIRDNNSSVIGPDRVINIRHYSPQVGTGPVILYNPYFR